MVDRLQFDFLLWPLVTTCGADPCSKNPPFIFTVQSNMDEVKITHNGTWLNGLNGGLDCHLLSCKTNTEVHSGQRQTFIYWLWYLTNIYWKWTFIPSENRLEANTWPEFVHVWSSQTSPSCLIGAAFYAKLICHFPPLLFAPLHCSLHGGSTGWAQPTDHVQEGTSITAESFDASRVP